MNKFKQAASYAIGAFGHDAFYAAFATYFVTFITSQLLEGKNGTQGNVWLIGTITTLMVAIRIIEIFFDPLIGALIDNTHTRWGKFKPWIMAGSCVSSLGLILLFTNFFGLTQSHPIIYLVLFVIIFVITDFTYSAHDVAFWGLLPSLSLESDDRTNIGTVARFGSTLGQTGVAIVLVPINVWFSQHFAGTTGNTQTRVGWFAFAVIISVISLIGAILTCWGTKEGESEVRKNVKKTSFRDIFHILGSNDQLMWVCVSYLLFALGWSVGSSLLVYYFRYVLGHPEAYSGVGVIQAILGILSVVSFPFLQRALGRKRVLIGSIAVMVIGFACLALSGGNVTMALISTGIMYVGQPLIFLSVLMTITDCVEYGQLKNGVRNESVTLTVRPLIDKLGGAVANGVVSVAAISAGMTGAATAADISATGVLTFKAFMIYAPVVFIILAAVVFGLKVTLTESKHEQIVEELEAKFDKDDKDIKDAAGSTAVADSVSVSTNDPTTATAK